MECSGTGLYNGRMKTRAYLDIETTGLGRQASRLTVVGVAVQNGGQGRFCQMIEEDISAERLAESLEGVDELYTYNGSRFDLPFLKFHLKTDIKATIRHTDLMYHCWKRNLKGGLKNVERLLGIRRQLTEVDGFMAVRLWWRYVNDADEGALQKLLAYNREDVMNLAVLRKKLAVD